MEAARLFEAGHSRAQVAELCAVSWRSAHEWHRAWSQGGPDALRARTKPGPAPKFDDQEVSLLEKELRRGPVAHG